MRSRAGSSRTANSATFLLAIRPTILIPLSVSSYPPAKYDSQVRAKPLLTVVGTESFATPLIRFNERRPVVWVDGYGHFDAPVGSAAQNNGEPEPFSAALAEFVGRVQAGNSS